ncbi:sensor histidine kinase [Frondihabitans cladoniiphilus]|uniref:histidine kinase n=1 Tax=Frondihabitans cladoniiphilus TaxID=715785 RepID=A0ABP8WBV1_9MICO
MDLRGARARAQAATLAAAQATPTVLPITDDDLLLPRPPGVVRRFWARHTRLADILIALVVLLLGYAESIDNGRGTQGADWFVHGWFVLPLVSAAALLWRRTRPVTSLVIVIVCSCILTVVVSRPDSTALVVAVYAMAVYSRPLFAWIGAGAAYAGYTVCAIAGGHFLDHSYVLVVALVVTLLFGSNIGNRKRYLDALIARAGQLARERDQQAQLATAAERSRIAREMHDIVAHSLSVMVRLSDGAEAVVETDPERSRTAVRQIGESGREALREMRRLLGVLREEGETESPTDIAPQPTLADLDHLLETYRSAGLPVAIQRVGDEPTADGVQVVIYRAVQEALTNALRYSAEPTRVLVRLEHTEQGTTVDVVDDGFLRGPAPSVGSGRGLVGLRERAALYGGVVEAGPRGADGRGWRMHMTLPQARGTSR